MPKRLNNSKMVFCTITFIHNYVLYISIHAYILGYIYKYNKNREQEMLFLCFLFFGKAFPYLKISLLSSSANNTAVFTSAR